MRGQVSVQLCPDGPLLVRGADVVLDADGVEHPVTRPVVAVCACGKSARFPWCDSTHKSLRHSDELNLCRGEHEPAAGGHEGKGRKQ